MSVKTLAFVQTMPPAQTPLVAIPVPATLASWGMEHIVIVCLISALLLAIVVKVLILADIDECSNSSLHNCDDNADCVDNTGSFQCTCQSGFRGNGTICSGKVKMISKCYVLLNTLLVCTDIDECEMSPCGINADCINTIGGHNCTCHLGYSGNGSVCIGKNDCIL